MKSWMRWLLMGALAFSCFPQAARAESEVDILLDALVKNGTITPVQAGQIRRQITETKEERNKLIAKEIVPDSARNIKWSGDMRLREEYLNQTGTGTNVNRQRFRFRLGMDAKVTDNLKVGARLASGSTTNPISTNQTFNTSFNHNTIVIDRAFVEYAPELPGVTEFKITGGKIANPFWVVGPLVWDDDLNFDGAAVHLGEDFGPMVNVFTNDGVFALQSGITEAASLWSTQGGVVFKPFPDSEEEVLKNIKLTGAVSYHDYKNVTHPLSESTAITTAGGLAGNTPGIADLNLFNPTFELSSQYLDVPFGMFGDWVHNFGQSTTKSNNTNGFMLGVKAGKARIPFDLRKGWEAGYFFERLEPDATFGAFTESDFGNGGTNHIGHVWWFKFATLKNSAIQLKYFTTKQITGVKNFVDTFQADWVTSF